MVIAATALGFVLVQLDVSIVNVALPTMGRELHSGVAALQWVVDAYTVTFAALLLSGGALGDRIGARRAYVGGFVVFVCASIACGFASTAGMLIVARVVQGAGAALLIPSSLALINHAYGNDSGERAKAVGLWTAAGSVALAAGPIAGGALIESIGWRSIFFVNVPLGAIGLWLTWRWVTETPPGKRTFDFPGQVLAVIALGLAIADVIAAGATGWKAPFVVWGFAAAIVFGAAFIFTEARSRAPMLPLDLFRRPGFSAPAIVGFAINLTLYGQIFVLSLFWQRTQGYGPLQTGLAFLPFCVSLGLANIITGLRQAAGALGVAVLGAISVHGVPGVRIGLLLSAALIGLALIVAIFGLRAPAKGASS